MALYNCVGEHLGAQVMLRPDQLHALLPIVSDINQEIRTLMSHDGRRDAVEMAPYYPWLAGGNSGMSPMPATYPAGYWSPSMREDRDKTFRDEGVYYQSC